MVEIAVKFLERVTGARPYTGNADRVCRGCVIDSREVEQDSIFVAFPGERVPFETLLAESDVLSLHCPATEQTRGVINAASLARMKEGAILLNTARGALCVSQDVADALESGRLRAYAADVAAREPILRSDPLLEASNCILTPHIAWAPRETRQRLLRLAAENLRAFLNGTPVNRVN